MPVLLFVRLRTAVFTLVFSLLFSPLIFAQGRPDTLRLSLADAEKRFIENNLDLVFKRYDISTAQAEIITARLFDNPEIGYENLFYNPDTRKFFQTSIADGQGQFEAQISQLFRLAGKRNKSIKLAQSGVKMAEYEFFDLMRTLRFTLKSSFNKLYYSQRSARVFDSEISSLQITLRAFEQQYARGNISAKEVLRIKSLLYNLQSEQHELLNTIEQTSGTLKQLTLIDPGVYILPLDTRTAAATKVEQITYQALIDSAALYRADLQLAKATVDYAGNNLRLQKAMAVPDITINGSFDLQGNDVKNYTGIGISMPLPLFNRNQGAIKQARIAVDAGEAAVKNQQNIMMNEVAGSYRNAIRVEKLYAGFDPDFEGDFERMVQEVNKNYLKRNISLLEFIDFYESYKDNTLQMNNLRLDLLNAREELNYVTGTSLF